MLSILSSNPAQYTTGRGSKTSSPKPKLFRSSSKSSTDGRLDMTLRIVPTGDEELEGL